MRPRAAIIRRIFSHQSFLAAALLFAFFPTLTFLGHLDAIYDGALGPDTTLPRITTAAIFSLSAEQASEFAEATEHAQHCHTDLGSCSGQPVPAGFGLFVMREVLIRPPAVALALLPGEVAAAFPMPGPSPLTPPPRFV